MSLSISTELNPEQKRAVLKTGGPVLILAGAGAGKTKTITERIAHMVENGIHPSEILAITFTNKAAKEMRERVEKRLKNNPSINRPISSLEGRPFISTFHALGAYILREQSNKISLKKHFSIFDNDDSKKVIREVLEKIGLDPKEYEPGKILAIISKEKGRGKEVGNYVEENNSGRFMQAIKQVWSEYEKILARENALDFDDLLLKTRNLLRNHDDVRTHYQNTWRYIHIDEYQDTNRTQYEISKMLVGKEKNICVVGDIDQNIYSWRGAEIKNIIDFETDYPEAEVIVLEENYRSTKTILETANAVIIKNQIRREKNLFTSNEVGDKIGLFAGFDEVSEAEFIALKAEELIKNGAKPDEMAILYRANFQSRVLEEAFLRRGVPYQILGTKFFDRKEIKDIVAYLRASLNPTGLSDMKRIINTPTRGIGKTTVAKIFSGQEEDLPLPMKTKLANFRKILEDIAKISIEKKPSETITFIIKNSKLEDEWKEGGKEESITRLENAYELANFASRYDTLEPEEGILSFLSDAALQSDQDEMKDEEKSVRLMTVHASKGLEFDTVFISGLEEGLFPHQRISEKHSTPEENEEERRLFYVALTRARKKVFLTYAQARTVFGRKQVNIPSEFIFDVPEEMVEEESVDETAIYRRPLLEIDF